jgi:hypothetical protein
VIKTVTLSGVPNLGAGKIGKVTRVVVGNQPPRKSDVKQFAKKPKTQQLTGAVHPKTKQR